MIEELSKTELMKCNGGTTRPAASKKNLFDWMVEDSANALIRYIQCSFHARPCKKDL